VASPKKIRRPKRARINMRIPAELLAWAKDYALLRNTTVTQVIINHLTELKEEAADV
jgi:hypothetical protein